MSELSVCCLHCGCSSFLIGVCKHVSAYRRITCFSVLKPHPLEKKKKSQGQSLKTTIYKIKLNLSARPTQTCPLTLKNVHHFLISLYSLFIRRLIYRSYHFWTLKMEAKISVSVITKKKKKNLWNLPQQFLTEITDCFLIIPQKKKKKINNLAAIIPTLTFYTTP